MSLESKVSVSESIKVSYSFGRMERCNELMVTFATFQDYQPVKMVLDAICTK